MATREFRIVSRWRVRGSVDAVYDIISKPEDLVRWWPEVYLRVEETDAGDENGVGRTLARISHQIRAPYF